MTQPAATHEHAGTCEKVFSVNIMARNLNLAYVRDLSTMWLDTCSTCNRRVLRTAKPGSDQRQWDEVVLYEGDNIDGEGQKGMGL